MRLIDADALKQMAQEYGFTFVDLQALDNAPTIDAVPVVRCKDCEHLEFSDFYGECGKGILGIVQPWDYCSRGERKDGEG